MSFSAINAFAQDPVSIYNVIRENGVQHFVTLHHVDGEYGWGILIYSQKGEQVLSVIDEDTGKLIFKYSHMDMMDTFSRMRLVEFDREKPLLASVWK